MGNSLQRIIDLQKEIIAGLLGVPTDSFTAQQGFFELGVNSIVSVDLVEALNKELEIDLGVDVVFDYKNIEELSRHICSQYEKYHDEGEKRAPRKKGKAPARDRAAGHLPGIPSDIAIIGISGKTGRADSVEELWTLLRDGKSVVEEINRKGWSEYFDAHSGENPSPRKAGLLNRIDTFDSLFFNLSPLEAGRMDPQQRLILEETYKALENAGYTGKRLTGREVGVFIGARASDYKEQALKSEKASSQLFLGNDMAILAARIAYFLNLKGPCLTIDTACSSALVAIHLACESLRKGEAEMAVAGSVFAMPSAEFLTLLAGTNTLSPRGVCRAFDNEADGIVVGEGVGALILKPLARAMEEGDYIHGVIKGSGVNQDGQTKGITAPSMLAQKELLTSVYTDAGVDPGTLSYLEAHGTGTKLGDPVEVKALTEAFNSFTEKKGFCVIGSHKPNVGHTIVNAGMAGIFKLLMAMKYGQIPPSININKINEHIDLSSGPFFLTQELMPWERKEGQPRRAGISSFGISGTNTHLILEEPPVREYSSRDEEKPWWLMVFSAKSKEALDRRLDQMIQWLEEEGNTCTVREIAFSLLTGREHFPLRCSFIVKDKADLKASLERVRQEGNAEGYYETSSQLNAGISEFKKYGESLIRELFGEEDFSSEEYKEKLTALSNLFIAGYDFDWEAGLDDHHQIPLPSYPFQGPSHWFSESPLVQAVHPLIQQNRSTFTEQCFESRFRGNEFFLAHHMVEKKKLLPGVAYLEMARAAVERSLKEPGKIRLRNIIWAAPVVQEGEEVDVKITLTPSGREGIAYEVTSGREESVLHSQGEAFIEEPGGQSRVLLSALIKQSWSRELSPGECYALFEAVGIEYGPGHRSLEKVYTDGNTALARLILPPCLGDSVQPFGLHPALLDGAFQSTMTLLPGLEKTGAAIPFSLEEMEILAPCTPSMWCVVYRRENLLTFDMDILDDEGIVLCRIKGLTLRYLEKKTVFVKPEEVSASVLPPGDHLLTPVWEEAALLPVGSGKEEKLLVIRGETGVRLEDEFPGAAGLEINLKKSVEEMTGLLEKQEEASHILWSPSRDFSSGGMGQEEGALCFFKLVKALAAAGYDKKPLALTVVISGTGTPGIGEPFFPVDASLEGLLGVALKEYPLWKARLADFPQGEKPGPLTLQPIPFSGEMYLFRRNRYWRRRMVMLKALDGGKSLYRENGVYVVIGGAGGIGEAWSEYVISRYGARVAWIGRRKQNKEIETKIRRLEKLGPAPLYFSADARDRAALDGACKKIKKELGQINGVIHGAIELKEQKIADLSPGDFNEGLASKVEVCAALADVFAGENLDFVLFFSSIQSLTRAPGQGDYAAGCTFKDAFAHWLGTQWSCAVKVINWGFWGSLGRVATPEYRGRMAVAGFGSIEPPEGMAVLEKFLASPLPQVVFLKTTKPLEIPGVASREILDILPQGKEVDIEGFGPGLLETAGKKESVHYGALEKLLGKRLRYEMESLGILDSAGNPVPGYNAGMFAGWLTSLLTVLKEKVPGSFKGVKMEEIEASWNALKESLPGTLGKQMALSETFLDNLGDILSGKSSVRDLVFPSLSLDLVTGPEEVQVSFLEEVISCYVEEILLKDPGADFRILEAGAGDGNASASVLKILGKYASRIKEYCYTDKSGAFLKGGRKKFAQKYPFMTFKKYDLEQLPGSQGLDQGVYDLVFGVRVFQRVDHLARAFNSCKSLLKKGGLLLLEDEAHHSLLNHLTFGLLRVWSAHQSVTPGIEASRDWEVLLGAQGFELPLALPEGLVFQGLKLVMGFSDGKICKSFSREAVKPAQEKKIEVFEEKIIQIPRIKESVPEAPVSRESRNGNLMEKTRHFLKKSLGGILKLSQGALDAAAPLAQYGLDSILIVRLNNQFRQVFGEDVGSTLLFEYQTINELAEHFVETKAGVLRDMFDLQEGTGGYAPEVLPEQAETRRSPGPLFRKLNVAPSREQDVAVVGLSGRYAGAENIARFWENLKAGKNGITEVPRERWNWEDYYGTQRGEDGTIYSKWGGFLKDIDKFEPLFFKISPRDAVRMDPQERLFLEEAYSCLEDAGYTPEGLNARGKVGVFVGVMNGNYPTGVSYWSIANRLSYIYDFHGPSMAVDTACSSSLTAVHLAVESVRSGLCESAIAGGVNLIITPVHYKRLTAVSMLTPDGECKAFGAGGDGFVDGEGVGAVLLKPLSRAVRDHDQIYGVIKGTMVNAGGKTNGFTVPNPRAQAELIKGAIKRAGVSPRDFTYLEAHGTGTSLGDPIEIKGLTTAFGEVSSRKQFCAIGSVKSNIGHCEGAAGVAGLTKLLLQMKYKTLVPSLHSRELNENIDFTSTPFRVQQKTEEWKSETPRLAGISSFGAGGANAHVVVEEYVAPGRRIPLQVSGDNPAIILLSARTAESLKKRAAGLLNALGQFDDSRLGDIAYTLQVGRVAMEQRLAFTALSLEEAKEKLASYLQNPVEARDVYQGKARENQDALSRLSEDEDLKEVLDRWIRKGKYEKILDLWVRGLTFEWDSLYDGLSPLRVSLPAYPFIGDSYWFEGPESLKVKTGKDRFSPAPVKVKALKTEEMKVSSAKPVIDLASFSALPAIEKQIMEKPRLELGGAPEIPVKKSAVFPVKEPVAPAKNEINPQSLPKGSPDVEKTLKDLLIEVLIIKESDVDRNKPFIDLGMDSISGVEWTRKINKTFGLDLEATKIYDYTTIGSYAEMVAAKLGDSAPETELVPAALKPSAPAVESEPVLDVITGLLIEVLLIKESEVTPDTPFIDLGMDSISGVEWIKKINKRYGTSVVATRIYDYTSLNLFADYLREQIGDNGAGGLSTDDILKQVYEGTLDIDDAVSQID